MAVKIFLSLYIILMSIFRFVYVSVCVCLCLYVPVCVYVCVRNHVWQCNHVLCVTVAAPAGGRLDTGERSICTVFSIQGRLQFSLPHLIIAPILSQRGMNPKIILMYISQNNVFLVRIKYSSICKLIS